MEFSCICIFALPRAENAYNNNKNYSLISFKIDELVKMKCDMLMKPNDV